MGIDPTAAFSLADLAIFDEAHLREAIANVSGAVAPAVAGRAFATDQPGTTGALAPLASRIEHALAPDDCAAFAQARQRVIPGSEREAAHRPCLICSSGS